MAAVLSLLIIIALSIFVVRVATIALTLTGMSREAASFQARSAFTRTGYTTKEAENVLEHPARRRIIMWLMFLGSVGFVGSMSTFLLTFVETAADHQMGRLVWMAGGLVVLWFLGHSRWIDHHMSRVIRRILQRYTDLDTRDYASLFQLSGGYAVIEMHVEPTDWVAGRNLNELKLTEEGILILGIYRASGRYVGAPHGSTRIMADDTLILYGSMSMLEELDERWSEDSQERGDAADATEEQDILPSSDDETAPPFIPQTAPDFAPANLRKQQEEIPES